MRLSIRISMISIFTAIGVWLSPLWFPILTSKAFPIQHMINALAGVLLGPVDAVIIAFLIGVLRVSYNLGTIYAFPGGLPGGFVVGLFHIALRKYVGRGRAAKLAVWTEPIGTVLIGATLSVFIVAPWIGDIKMMQSISQNVLLGLLTLYAGWSISSFSGVTIAFLIIIFLDKSGFLGKMGYYEGGSDR